MTLQRQKILTALEELGGHPTAEEIFLFVRQDNPEINLSTVYRNLRILESQGLINPRWFDGDRRQQRFDPAIQTDHSHFRCQDCGRIIEFESEEIKHISAQFSVRNQVVVCSATFTLYGYCNECQTRRTTR